MKNDDTSHGMRESDDGAAEKLTERPWIHLETTHDVESWISNYDWELRRHAAQAGAAEAAIGFRLAHGGEIVVQTTPEGDIRLELTPEAEWVAPAIGAATGIGAPNAPNAALWKLPADVLTQLLLGLSSLIVSTRPVTVTKKKQRITW